MTQHTSRLCKSYFTKKESNGVLHQMTWHQTNWDGLGWIGPQSERKAANKSSAYVGTPSRLLEKHSRWSWLRECQQCAQLSSSQRVATLNNLKSKIYFDLFNTFLVTIWFHTCYFIVLMSSLLFYNVENSTNKEKPSMSRCSKIFSVKHKSYKGIQYLFFRQCFRLFYELVVA
jgi:hypothetical protein